MNKSQLIDAMATESNMTKRETKKALEAFVKVTSETLRNGDKIALVGFGSFGVAERNARKGRNPKSGKEIKIEAKKVVKFKVGSELAEMVK